MQLKPNVYALGKYQWEVLPATSIEDCCIPSWMYQLKIRWSREFDTTPCFQAVVHKDPLAFADSDPVWRRKKSLWWAEKDGCFTSHYHDGTLSWNDEKQAWISSSQQGYAGRSFEIFMDPEIPDTEMFQNGRNKVILRGPWHKGGPNGYTALATRLKNKHDTYPFCFGLCVKDSIIIKSFYNFFPNHYLAIVREKSDRRDAGGKTHPGAERVFLEPFLPTQQVPRDIISNRRLELTAELGQWKRDNPEEAESLNPNVGHLVKDHDGHVYYVQSEIKQGGSHSLKLVRLDVLGVNWSTPIFISPNAIGRTFTRTKDRV